MLYKSGLDDRGKNMARKGGLSRLGVVNWLGLLSLIALLGSLALLPSSIEGSSTKTTQMSSQTSQFSGQGFDKCEVPSLAEMQIWINASPYRVVNLYIGGSARGCPNSNLTSSFVSQLSGQGWKFIPTWVGPQASCSGYVSRMSQDPTMAYNQGVAEANAAIAAAGTLGFSTGIIIYYDLERYDTTNTDCRDAAKSFISGWSGQLQATSNLAGVYGSSCGSGMSDFATIPNVPDAVWLANWYPTNSYDPNATVWNVSCVSDGLWSNQQRIRQYAGDHAETWGGVTLAPIDSNVIDGIVAEVAPSAVSPPTNFTGVAVSQTQIRLTWNDVANEQNYDLWRVRSGSTWEFVATLSANSVAYNDPGLSPETSYKYAIRAYAGSTSSSWVYSGWVRTPGAPVAAPTNFTGFAASSTQINLTWQDNASNEQNYDLWRVPSGGSWQKVTTLSANATSYNDSVVVSDTWYKYAIRAYAGSTSSSWVYSGWIETPGDPIAAPTFLIGVAASSTQINLTWNDVYNEQNYDLWRYRWQGSGWEKVATRPANTTSYNDTGASANGWYQYAIRAYRGNTTSVWTYSNWVKTP